MDKLGSSNNLLNYKNNNDFKKQKEIKRNSV